MTQNARPKQVNLVFTPDQYRQFTMIAEREETTVTALLWDRCYSLLADPMENPGGTVPPREENGR